MAPRPPKVKKGSPPPIDKLLVPAIVVGVAMLAYQFFKGLSAEIPRVNVLDELELREVFFGEGGSGKSYAVLCHAEESKSQISSVFQDASNDGSSPADFRVVDCDYVLPSSEKSVAQRFGLDMKKRPTIFVSGAVGEPQQIPDKHLKTGKMLVKYLRSKLEVRAAKIETTQDLRVKCLEKEICGLLLKGSKKAPGYVKDAMNKLLKEFPNVGFASIDSSVLYAKNLEEYLPELADSQPRFVVFKKISGSTKPGADRLVSSLAALPTNGVSYGQMSNLVAGVVQGTETMTKIPSLPIVKTRTKKLEAEEKAKRERKLDQQRRKTEGGTASSSGGSSGDNDGSRDGRKAERERRREEHRKANNVREKTPEEIAEMERKRRARMEEEANKWNMAPDDVPDVGDTVYDDEPLNYMSDEDEDLDGGDDEEDEGEDVIDLD